MSAGCLHAVDDSVRCHERSQSDILKKTQMKLFVRFSQLFQSIIAHLLKYLFKYFLKQ